mgnify:FL=1
MFDIAPPQDPLQKRGQGPLPQDDTRRNNRGHGPLLPKLVGFGEDADGDVQAEFEGVVVQAVFADAV